MIRMPYWLVALVMLALVAGAWIVVREVAARAEAEAVTRAEQIRADSLDRVLDSARAGLVLLRANADSADSAAARSLRELARARQEAQARIRAGEEATRRAKAILGDSRASVDSALAVLRGTGIGLPVDALAQRIHAEREATEALLDTERSRAESYAALLAVSDSALTAMESRYHAREAMLHGLETTLSQTEEALVTERRLKEAWKARATPGAWARLKGAAPWVSGALAVGVLLGAVR